MSNSFGKPVKKIVVLGGGTSGFLTALAIKKQLPEIELVVVRSTKLGVIGVGEGTILSVVQFLNQFLGIPFHVLYQEAKAAPKLGIKYIWGKHPSFSFTFTGQLYQPNHNLEYPKGYYCSDNFDFADLNSALIANDKVCIKLPNGKPQFNKSVAYHFENKHFVSYLERLADEANILKVDDVFKQANSNEEGITSLVLESGQEVDGDLFIDCSGFRSELIDGVLNEEFVDFSDALFCDSAVVGGWPREKDDIFHPYTTAETMDAGWCWQIEHEKLVNRGYVFCSKFISDEQAELEFRTKNPKANIAKVIRFNTGVRRRVWVKNVIAIGNSAGFVEPLEATAIAMICDSAVRLVKALKASGNHIVPIQRDIFNRVVFENWIIIRDFLALHYKFNDRLNTPFWKAARADVNIGEVQQLVDYYRSVGPDITLLNSDLKRNFFTGEGYLVMLVGQGVPYQRSVNISKEEWEKMAALQNPTRCSCEKRFVC